MTFYYAYANHLYQSQIYWKISNYSRIFPISKLTLQNPIPLISPSHERRSNSVKMISPSNGDKMWYKYFLTVNLSDLFTKTPENIIWPFDTTICLPDLKKYYWACHLSRILDWALHSNCKDWVRLENSLSPLPIRSAPWLSLNHIPSTLKEHPLIKPTLRCFRETCIKLYISSVLWPLTPLRLNPAFLPGMSAQFLTNQWQHPEILEHEFFHNGSLLERLMLVPTLTKTLSCSGSISNPSLSTRDQS